MGLAAHPTSSQLLVLYEDGALRGYVMSSVGLSSAWGASYFLPGVLTWGCLQVGVCHQGVCDVECWAVVLVARVTCQVCVVGRGRGMRGGVGWGRGEAAAGLFVTAGRRVSRAQSMAGS